jgi:uncharacterized phiE125 gp8 family phage protein
MKLHLHESLVDAANDTYIDSLVGAAVDWIESFTRQPLVTTTYTYYLDAFPSDEIILPRSPVTAVSAITYVDTNGATQTWSSGNYSIQSQLGIIRTSYGNTFPETRSITNAVAIGFSAGYGSANAVPNGLKLAVKMLVAHWYEHRMAVSEVVSRYQQTELPLGVKNLLWPFRMVSFT